MNADLKLAISSMARHLIVAGAGALAARGLLSGDEAQQIAAPLAGLAMAAATQVWAWGHTTRFAAAMDDAASMADQIFALTSASAEIVQAVRAPSGRLVELPATALVQSGPATGGLLSPLSAPVAVTPSAPAPESAIPPVSPSCSTGMCGV